MHATLYREGNSAVSSGGGHPYSYTADGSEPAITSQGFTYHPTRTVIDLTGMDDVRIVCNAIDVSGTAGSVTLLLEYWDHVADSWASTGASVTVNGEGLHKGAYVSLPTAAADDTTLRIVTSDETGNGGAVITPLSITLDARA